MKKYFFITLAGISALFFVWQKYNLNQPALASNTTPTIVTTSSVHFSHEVVVMLENHSYNSVVGNKSLPYLNYLANTYGLATKYYANTHPSIGNYFMLTTGQIITNNDKYSKTVSENNIVRIFNAASTSWKVYAEGLPNTGYIGGNKGWYLKRHNPFAYLSDVINNTSTRQNMVPSNRFALDAASSALPQFSFVVPDACSDAHDCALTVADKWLKKTLDPLLKNPNFMKSGLLVILFDEGTARDLAGGGGHIPVILIGDAVKPKFTSTQKYQHQNLLRTLLQGLGITSYPGLSASATPMNEFFK